MKGYKFWMENKTFFFLASKNRTGVMPVFHGLEAEFLTSKPERWSQGAKLVH